MNKGLGKDQTILARSISNYGSKVYLEPFSLLGNTSMGPDRKSFSIFHNGSWVKGKKVESRSDIIYHIITVNDKEIYVGEDQLNCTIRGLISSSQLTEEDYLLFNTRELNSYCEQDLHLTYDQGFVVGLFIGAGCFGRYNHDKYNNEYLSDIQFSLNKNNYLFCKQYIDKVNKYLGGKRNSRHDSEQNNGYRIRISSRQLASFIQYWTNWERGTSSSTVELNILCLLQSKDFRLGIIDGWHIADGDISGKRSFTTSKKLIMQIETILTSLGRVSKIDVAVKSGHKIVIRGKEYKSNYPVYRVTWYDVNNRRILKDTYKIINNSIYLKIKSIEKIKNKDKLYSFKLLNTEEPYFTLPNGMIIYMGDERC